MGSRVRVGVDRVDVVYELSIFLWEMERKERSRHRKIETIQIPRFSETYQVLLSSFVIKYDVESFDKQGKV